MSLVVIPENARARLQALFEINMSERATIHRPNYVRNAQAGRDRTFTDVATDVPCLVTVANITPREDLRVRQSFVQTLDFIFFPLDTDIRAIDEVTVAGEVGTRRYHVAKVISFRTGSAVKQVIASLVE